MKKRSIPGLMLLSLLLAATLITGCSSTTPPATSSSAAPAAPASSETPSSSEAAPAPEVPVEIAKIDIAVHSNGPGATLVAVAQEKGFFEEYGIEPNIVIVESGPVEMAAMRADKPTLDVGYIGPGVAWNPLDSSGNQLSFLFFDQLGNSERLIARKGLFTPAADGTFDHAALYQGLKGQTIYFEVGTTPGGWFKNLLTAINEGRPEGEQLWIACEDPAYLQGYTAPNQNPENKVMVVNYANANIAAGMSTAGADRVDIAVAFEPIPSSIVKNSDDVEVLADNKLLPPEKVFPGTFVARDSWTNENPEVTQRVINALLKAALWRADNLDESLRIAERLCQAPEGTYPLAMYCLTKDDYKNWFATPDSQGYDHLRSLYGERLANVPEGVEAKKFEDTYDFSFMLKAIEELG